ncbi:hypothetical protein [Kitasatospora griseola]|uniref:hypothetical protein n=1 Tax=Kitasatospora griseola TaxID=2064 RepID=UPI00341E95B4
MTPTPRFAPPHLAGTVEASGSAVVPGAGVGEADRLGTGASAAGAGCRPGVRVQVHERADGQNAEDRDQQVGQPALDGVQQAWPTMAGAMAEPIGSACRSVVPPGRVVCRPWAAGTTDQQSRSTAMSHSVITRCSRIIAAR